MFYFLSLFLFHCGENVEMCILVFFLSKLFQYFCVFVFFQEICNTHSLLKEYAHLIAPDPMDPLNEILDDLGPVPTVHQLLGCKLFKLYCHT